MHKYIHIYKQGDDSGSACFEDLVPEATNCYYTAIDTYIRLGRCCLASSLYSEMAGYYALMHKVHVCLGVHTCIHTSIHENNHTYIRPGRSLSGKQSLSRNCRIVCTHAHKYIHIHTHKNIHTYIYTHTYTEWWCSCHVRKGCRANRKRVPSNSSVMSWAGAAL